ncbi:aminotransferase [Streptomyces sp. A7024]|uniref:Aminotransferase n=1 Tax=Streptomyces coryli TaxID=1128680 RepID=A0A6G4TZD9_9ACTN|nr:glycogen debranching N-terminal domain-containing protein [Streptomyces coryli]NGN65193.1 aminotransferase [Streptomyces coryli]
MTAADRVLLVRDGTFAALTAGGGITGRRGTSPDGLFVRDARHLSRWELTVDGAEPAVLVPAGSATPATCVLTPEGVRDQPAGYAVFREQAVASGLLLERLRLVSNRPGGITARLELTVDADFADQFELRADGRTYGKGDAVRTAEVRADGVEFSYRRGEWYSRTNMTAAPAPDEVTTEGTAHRLVWELALPAHGSTELALRVEARPDGGGEPSKAATPGEAAAELSADTMAFTGRAGQATPNPARPADPGQATPNPARPALEAIRAERGFGDAQRNALSHACAQGLTDLATLRIPATGPKGEPLKPPAAGIPWFLTLFGRDSLLSSLFALPYRPELAEHTLLTLAATQGTTYDPFRGEQPGRIVHEIRHGELARFRQVPYGRYYGSVDATPLFLVLLHEHRDLAKRLEPQARAAIDWMFKDGGLAEHGWLVYDPDPNGLVNQNWKDSEGAICFADGTQAAGPIAVAEAQGYAYDALARTAQLAREVWQDTACADRLDTAAADLRTRFVRDFWLPEADFPALALDGTGRKADALASDAGHLLWSGILDQARGERVGRRLLRDDFFTGWAIRTLAAEQTPYHPLSYHRGSCWPHDNAVIALGLARYGLYDELLTLTRGLLDTAAHHDWRLPEVLAGYSRTDHPAPVPYPHACSPQAWAAATPLALLTALTGRPADSGGGGA